MYDPPSSTLKGKQGDQSGLPFFFAELYEERDLPGVLVELMNDTPWCDEVGEYVPMDDPARVHLTPEAGM